ncbi:MAG TPA: ethylammeline chlorohydrolase, partial [Acidimicrobiaceae bacterium]|nr:ethylammeline chlorohydrolase [Acidimicrobiaceae bacterium]
AVHRREHDPDGTVTVGFGPHSVYNLGPGACAETAAAAADLDALLHIHVAETRTEGADVEAAHGGASTVRILADAGVFDGRVLAAHCVWLSDDDIATLAERAVAVAHCPVSNMKLGSGTARVPEMAAAGITVGLATDGPASNDNLDLWEEVKLAPLLARVTAHDPTVLGAADAVSMATRGGAAALGLDVGTLEPGRWADFIRIDTDDAAFVPVTSPDELVAHVAWSGSGRRVADVWVAGRQVVSDGTCTTVDESEARAQVQKRAERLATG